MTPQELAEVRPRLLDFAAELLGGPPRKGQRAAGQVYVRGLSAGGLCGRAGWDAAGLDDPVAAARARGRREQARIPDQVRHTEKWRLALEMIEEMTGPGGWGVLEEITAAGGARPVVVTDAGYGDNTAFRLELDARGWQYAVAVKGTTSAYPGDAQPVTRSLGGGPGRPPGPGYPGPPVNLRQLPLA